MDPYKILGISSNATNDEVKKAYRELSRKYHPDSYVDNPLSDLAEEKFKEVQDAYDQIMKQREGGYNQQSNYQSSNSGYQQQEPAEMQAVYNYLNARRYREALNVLSGISNRDARWYYLSAVANGGMGNNVVAYNHAQQAVNMEPGNREYSDLLNQMQWRNQRYQNSGGYGGGYGNNGSSCGTGNLCCDLWCADSLCECMGGDMIPCI